ncbi:MAG TPA: TetR family transcriptional regulator C-terminal domain-containing protein [Terriglobales bacterium]|jgi:AcrR family transcriptional regulator|nr:TetR family transcriptional regulator C-terminal domain-containing protein [Terriglobales bacterium]
MLTVPRTRRSKASAPRDPERTRKRLLSAASQEVYKSGFQGTDLETILDAAGVTKGALYYHFENKEALGYAVVDEVLTGITREKWLEPLRGAADPLAALKGIFLGTSLRPEHVAGGCPLNNLAQEMSPLDEGFRKRLAKVFALWHGAIAGALRDAQKRGLVRRDVNADETATFLMAAYEGYISLSKNSQDASLLRQGNKALAQYLETLRPA